jgi:lipoprotein-releasing system permease protein
VNFELFVALRYLLALRKQAFISLISLFAVAGVSLGVASLIVVIGVMNGFTHDLREKILGVNADVIVGSFEGPFADYRELAAKVAATPGVIGVTPFVYTEVMASGEKGVKGLVLRGIDPASAGGVLSIGKDMTLGKLEDLGAPGDLPGVIVGSELAQALGLHLGAMVNLLSPAGKKTAAGFSPKIVPFRVAGVFRTGMYEYDSSLGYVTIAAAQDLLGFKNDLASGLEIRLADVDDAQDVAKLLRDKIGKFPLYVRSWMDMNANLFAALKLEKTAMFIILVMIVLVGSFSIVTTLVMLVLRKTKDIAVLMSMGAREKSIRTIFMLQGTIIGAVGTVLGFLLGVPASLLLKKYQFIELPPGVYPVDYLPVRLEAVDLLSIGLAAFLLCFVATIYPARKAAALKPAEALRYE